MKFTEMKTEGKDSFRDDEFKNIQSFHVRYSFDHGK